MKKIALFIMTAAIAALTSCGTDTPQSKSDSKGKGSSSSEVSADMEENALFDSYIVLTSENDLSSEQLDEVISVVSRRADEMGAPNRTASDVEPNSVRISFNYAEGTSEKLLESITEKNILEFRRGTDNSGEVIFTNEDVASAENMIMSEMDGSYAVSLTLNEEAAVKFNEITAELAGTDESLSIWFDGELLSSPKVNAAITNGIAMITGDFDADSSAELAKKISSVPLRYDLTVADHSFAAE